MTDKLVDAISPAQAINKVVTPLSFTWSISMPACPSKKCAISTLAYCVAIISGEEFHIPDIVEQSMLVAHDY